VVLADVPASFLHRKPAQKLKLQLQTLCRTRPGRGAGLHQARRAANRPGSRPEPELSAALLGPTRQGWEGSRWSFQGGRGNDHRFAGDDRFASRRDARPRPSEQATKQAPERAGRSLAPLRDALQFVRQSGRRPPFAPTDHRLPSGNPAGLTEMAKRRAGRLACPFFGWQFAGRGKRDALPYV
jgi:hypothetical protein